MKRRNVVRCDVFHRVRLAVACGRDRLASASAQAAQIASAGQAGDAVAANKATVQKYCVSCHNEKVKSGGLALSTLDMARVREAKPTPGNT